jgi:hypothetical protein
MTDRQELIEQRAVEIWEKDSRIDPYVKPDFDELSPQYQGRLKAQARRELEQYPALRTRED